jgi:uncharacterized protein (TIRG00374 family)
VSVGLLAWVFTSLEFHDRVTLKDRTEIRGKVLSQTEEEIIIRENGREREIPIADVAPVKGEGKDGERLYYRRGFFTIIGSAGLSLLILGMLYYGLVNILGTIRWYILLRAQGMRISLWRVFHLSFLGYFFNNVMPGLTGGDLAKAYYVARDTTKKTAAVTTVFLDRLIGITVLASLSGIMILINFGDSRFHNLAIIVFVFLGVVALGGIAVFSRRIRNTLRLNLLVKKIPFEGVRRILKEIDQAVFLFRNHKVAILVAVLISFAVHCVSVSTNIIFGSAMDVPMRWQEYFIFMPIIFMIMSIPISLSGWGVGEKSYQGLLGMVGVPLNQAAMMGVLFNLTRTVWSLPGAIFMALGGKRPSAEKMKEELEYDVDKETKKEENSITEGTAHADR